MAPFNWPSPRILMRSFFPARRALCSTSGVMVFSPNSTRRSRFTTANSLRKILVKPRLGRRRCKGICPPSKPRIMREPERERCPLWPRVEVLPIPLPIPRPTRLRFAVAPLGGRNVERFIMQSLFYCREAACCVSTQQNLLGNNLDQMGHLLHHAADRG